MDRGIGAGSKLCAKREQQRLQELHKQKLKVVRPLVDTSQPRVAHLEHVRNNLKREQKLEERYAEIDRENRILLQKMTDIMTTGVPSKVASSAVAESRRPPLGPMSLNRDARKKELMRITKENQHILRRIQRAQPVYNHVEMEGMHRRHLDYVKNCTEYPVVLRTPRSARDSGRNTSFELAPLTGAASPRPQSARSSSTPPIR